RRPRQLHRAGRHPPRRGPRLDRSHHRAPPHARRADLRALVHGRVGLREAVQDGRAADLTPATLAAHTPRFLKEPLLMRIGSYSAHWNWHPPCPIKPCMSTNSSRWLTAAWPGMGHVGSIAAGYLVHRLKAPAVMDLQARGFFDIEQVA